MFKFQSENYVQNIVSSVFESEEPLYQCSGCDQIYWWGKKPGQSAVRAEKLVKNLVKLADEVYKRKEEQAKKVADYYNSSKNKCFLPAQQLKRISSLEESKMLYKPDMDEQFSRSTLWLLQNNILVSSMGDGNGKNNKNKLSISIPIVNDDLIYYPNTNFLYKNPFGETNSSTNTTDTFDGCIDYLLYFDGNRSSSSIKAHPRDTILKGINDGKLPNRHWPSDHRLLSCEFDIGL